MKHEKLALERIKALKLKNPEEGEFYEKLYGIVIDHFVFYRLAKHELLKQESRAFNPLDGILNLFSKFELLNFLTSYFFPTACFFIRISLAYINFYRGEKTINLNNEISGKISPIFQTEASISEKMSHTIVSLMDSVEYREWLVRRLKEKDERRLSGLDKISNLPGQILEKLHLTG